ncbi:hypothetical protein [Owenweeksia hongkongensis]|uniref:hypothetical protein n=1 Tax=Owenweeksia hongkongensis TaxID=253245 RepID=UPI003A90C5C8
MKQVLVAVLTCLSFLGSANNDSVVVEWGERHNISESGFRYVFGVDEHEFYARAMADVPRGKSPYLINKHDLKTGLVNETYVIPYPEEFEEKVTIERCSFINDRVEIWISVFQAEIDKRVIYIGGMDKNGSFSPLKEIESFDGEEGVNIKSANKGEDLFMFKYLTDERNKKQRLDLRLISKNGQPVWRKSVILPYEDKYLNIKNLSMDRDGDVYIFGYQKLKRREVEEAYSKNSGQKYLLFKILEAEEVAEEVNLELEDKFVTSSSMKVDFLEGKIVVVGLYSDEVFFRAGGHFYVTVDKSQFKVDKKVVEPFPSDCLSMFISERKAEKGKELEYFYLNSFMNRGEGKSLITAQQWFTSDPETNGDKKYNRCNILLIKLDEDGHAIWRSGILKDQKSASRKTEGLSYLLKTDGDDLLFLFNDHPKNIELRTKGKRLKETENLKKATVTMARVSSEGLVSYKHLWNNRELKWVLLPENCKYLQDDKVLIYGGYEREFRFGIMHF